MRRTEEEGDRSAELTITKRAKNGPFARYGHAQSRATAGEQLSRPIEEGVCDLLLTFDCDSVCNYDVDELRPSFAEVGHDRVLVQVHGVADELHQQFVEMQRIAVGYDRWQIEGDEEHEHDE